MKRIALLVLSIALSTLSLSAQERAKDYAELIRSLELSYKLLPFIPNYSYTASSILDALPTIEEKEGETSVQYNTWVYRLAECYYMGNRYSEAISVIDELYDKREYLPEEERFHLYEIYTNSLIKLEEFTRAEIVSEAAVQDASTTGDKKSRVMAILCRFRARSANPRAQYEELWSLLKEGFLNNDTDRYSLTSFNILERMLILSWNNNRLEDVDFVIDRLHWLEDKTEDINTQCAIQSLLYEYYSVSATENNFEQLESIIIRTEKKYNDYCHILDEETKHSNGTTLNQVQMQAFRLLLSLWNDFSELTERIGLREKSILYCNKIIKALTQEEDGTSSTHAERIAHVEDFLDGKYLSRAYLRKGNQQITRAHEELKQSLSAQSTLSRADTLRFMSAFDSLKYNYDAAFASLEFDSDDLVTNRLKTMNDEDREYEIRNYRTVLSPALYGAFLFPDSKYIKSAFNLLMFFKNLLLYCEKGEPYLPEKVDDIRLQPKEAVIEFGYDEDRSDYYALILNGSSRDLAIESIRGAWLEAELQKGMMYRDSVFCDSLMRCFESHISDCDVVYYSPTGLFNTINLDAVCRQTNNHHSFMAISSSRLLCRQIADKKLKTAVLFGGLTYGSGEEIQVDSSRAGWNSLLFSKEEVDRIAKTMNSGQCNATLFSGLDGTESVVKGLSHNSPDIIHFATHGFFIEDGSSNPYYDDNILIKTMNRSGLIMSNGQYAWLGNPVPEGQEDGVLLAGEIAMLDLAGTDIVSLSACNTGQGVISSEGVFGLQRAFKKAGVQTILMCLWSIQDNVAMDFMDSFYSNLFQGKSKRQSFDNAQGLIYAKYGADPYYWAPFVMIDGVESDVRMTENAHFQGHSEHGYINGHSWVDLGLSVRWASCNVGATRPEEFGSYFAWGETSPKETYQSDNYRYSIYNESSHVSTITKYNTRPNLGMVDNRIELDNADDAASKNWGAGWRIPTEREMKELLDNCRKEWVVLNGQPGYLFISLVNQNSIFLPAAGGSFYSSHDLGKNERGWYVTSTLIKDSPFEYRQLQFGPPEEKTNQNPITIGHSARDYGVTIRPVIDK